MGAYVAYKVDTRTNIPLFRKKSFTVQRRFSDFLGLHDKLVEKYLRSGRIIPPAPEKSVIGKLSSVYYLMINVYYMMISFFILVHGSVCIKSRLCVHIYNYLQIQLGQSLRLKTINQIQHLIWQK